MADLHTPQKVHLTQTYEGVVTCPQCQKRKQKPFASYLGVTPYLRVKCGCGAVFPILLDLRGYYRKRTYLPGRYTKLTTQLSGQILIANLSFSGMGFVTKTPHPLLCVGDRIELRFHLDDPQASSLCKHAVVKHVHGRAIGAAFCHLNAYEKELGFYLMAPTEELEL